MAHLDVEQEWVGEWYVPGASKKVPGTLRYSDGQLRLHLLDSLLGTENKVIKTIHGRTSGGIVTITDVKFDALLRKHGIAYSAIFGKHAEADDCVFKVSIGFDILKEWAMPDRDHTDALQVFDPDRKEEFGKGGREIFESQLDEDVKCTLVVSLGSSHHVIEGARQYHNSGFAIESKRGMSLKDMVYKYVNAIKHFLMATMGRPLNLSEIFIQASPSTMLPVYLPADKRGKGGSDLNHFFNIEPTKGSFGTILRKWFGLYSAGPYYLERLFQTYSTPYTDPLHFPAYSAVLEMCHYAATSLSSSKTRQVEIVGWALGRFENDFDNICEFSKKVRAFRNALVHYKPSRDTDNEDLHMVTHDLFYLIRVILLEQCGVRVRHEHARFVFLKKTTTSKRFSTGLNDKGAYP